MLRQQVSVTLDGEHIPGSVFTVTVLEAISLGGEGKIRVYYSTTNKAGTRFCLLRLVLRCAQCITEPLPCRQIPCGRGKPAEAARKEGHPPPP